VFTRSTFGFALVLALLSGCTSHTIDRRYTPYRPPVANSTSPERHHPTMRPYTVLGKRYYPTVVHVGEVFEGRASWYGPNFHGKKTSNGESYNMWQMTAAHKTLPMNTIVRVTNKNNGMSTVVRINDRGPFVNSRIIDLSKKAASEIEMVGDGTAPVRLEVLGFNKKGVRQITKTSIRKDVKEVVIGEYALQIGSFSKIEGAIRTQERYNNASGRYKTVIKDIDDGNRRLFKVLLTGFRGEEEARDYKVNNFTDAFIVREL